VAVGQRVVGPVTDVGTVTQPATAPERSPVEPGWRLTRVTGLFLAVLLPLHVAVVVVAGDIGRTSLATITGRLGGPVWPAVEWATFVLALVHGFLVAQAWLLRTWPPTGRRDAAIVVSGVVAVQAGLAVTVAILLLS
jgi:succinate dehydrogenase hydrophobic anchor subunit